MEQPSISRRTFFGGAIALAAASALPLSAFAEPVPLICGDGVHDDTAGLQALLDGKPFRVASGAPNVVYRNTGGDVYITGGTYRITEALFVRDRTAFITDCTLFLDRSADWLPNGANSGAINFKLPVAA